MSAHNSNYNEDIAVVPLMMITNKMVQLTPTKQLRQGAVAQGKIDYSQIFGIFMRCVSQKK